MIDPHELRMGNYVLNKGVVEQIKLGSDIDRSEYRDPIPLSWEWMQKLDFELDDSWHIATGYGLELRNFGALYQWEIYGTNYPHQEYVHQLQNLIYAITGEELTVKEKV